MAEVPREFAELPIDDIVIKTRPRDDLGDLSSLQASIERVGILFPLIVDRDNILISGFRRLEAARKARIIRVPVLRLGIACDSMEALDVQSGENLCRMALTPAERDRQIQLKKDRLGSSSSSSSSSGWLSKLKSLFAGS